MFLGSPHRWARPPNPPLPASTPEEHRPPGPSSPCSAGKPHPHARTSSRGASPERSPLSTAPAGRPNAANPPPDLPHPALSSRFITPPALAAGKPPPCRTPPRPFLQLAAVLPPPPPCSTSSPALPTRSPSYPGVNLTQQGSTPALHPAITRPRVPFFSYPRVDCSTATTRSPPYRSSSSLRPGTQHPFLPTRAPASAAARLTPG